MSKRLEQEDRANGIVRPAGYYDAKPVRSIPHKKDNTSYLTVGLKVATAVGSIALLGWLFVSCSRSASDATARLGSSTDLCVAKGIQYFKDAGSYPYLSDGESAERAAARLCAITVTQFD